MAEMQALLSLEWLGKPPNVMEVQLVCIFIQLEHTEVKEAIVGDIVKSPWHERNKPRSCVARKPGNGFETMLYFDRRTDGCNHWGQAS